MAALMLFADAVVTATAVGVARWLANFVVEVNSANSITASVFRPHDDA